MSDTVFRHFTYKHAIYEWQYHPDVSGEATIALYCYGPSGCEIYFQELGIYNYADNMCGFSGGFMLDEYTVEYPAHVTDFFEFYVLPIAFVFAAVAGIRRLATAGRTPAQTLLH